MMQTNRKIKRYFFALILLVLSAYMTVFIKDTVDSLNPEKSLPIISVNVGYTVPYVVRSGYTWKFGLKTVRSPYVTPPDVPLITYDCDPNVPIVINFTAPYETIAVYQAQGLAPTEFTELRYTLNTPEEEGIYVYKIVANFSKGDIVYYFAVEVKKSNHIA